MYICARDRCSVYTCVGSKRGWCRLRIESSESCLLLSPPVSKPGTQLVMCRQRVSLDMEMYNRRQAAENYVTTIFWHTVRVGHCHVIDAVHMLVCIYTHYQCNMQKDDIII